MGIEELLDFDMDSEDSDSSVSVSGGTSVEQGILGEVTDIEPNKVSVEVEVSSVEHDKVSVEDGFSGENASIDLGIMDLIDFDMGDASDLVDFDMDLVSEVDTVEGSFRTNEGFEGSEGLEGSEAVATGIDWVKQVGGTDLVDFDMEDEPVSVGEEDTLIESSLIDFDMPSDDSNLMEVSNTIDIDILVYIPRMLRAYIERIKKGVMVCYAIVMLAVIGFVFSGEVSYGGGSSDMWLQEFISGNFETCDSMCIYQKDVILSSDMALVGTYGKSVEMYKTLLRTASSCIDEVLAEGDGKYTLKVQQVRSVDEVSIDDKALSNLVTRYKSNELSKQDLKQELETLYFDAFLRSVVTEKTDSIKECKVHIKDVDGHVENTYSTIREVLRASNLYSNMKVFEESAQATFEIYLQE